MTQYAIKYNPNTGELEKVPLDFPSIDSSFEPLILRVAKDELRKVQEKLEKELKKIRADIQDKKKCAFPDVDFSPILELANEDNMSEAEQYYFRDLYDNDDLYIQAGVNHKGVVFSLGDNEMTLSLNDIPRFLDQFQKLATELLPDEITGTDYLYDKSVESTPAPAPSIDSKPRKSDIKETHSFMGKSGGRLVATIYKNGNVLTLHIENALGVVDFDAERLEQIIDILREKLNPAPANFDSLSIEETELVMGIGHFYNLIWSAFPDSFVFIVGGNESRITHHDAKSLALKILGKLGESYPGSIDVPYDYSLPPLPANSAYKIGAESAVIFIYPAPLAGRYDLYDSETETAPAGVRIELTGGGLSSRAEFTIEEARALVVGLAEVLNRLPDESGV